ncbi:MAG: DUF1841 family protein [Candidatus Eremiobacteraeota bacterium]|nr:DUF1841 family protein [Candidatus Eremiobacteraeota bacterium]
MFESLQKQQKLMDVWKKGKNEIKLKIDEQEIYEIMKMHPEYHKFFDSGDVFNMLNKKEKTNPFFHIILHTLVKKQVDEREPGIVRAAYHHLVNNKDIDSHEAYHGFMIILADEMHDMMKRRGKLNMERYKSRIEKFLE